MIRSVLRKDTEHAALVDHDPEAVAALEIHGKPSVLSDALRMPVEAVLLVHKSRKLIAPDGNRGVGLRVREFDHDRRLMQREGVGVRDGYEGEGFRHLLCVLQSSRFIDHRIFFGRHLLNPRDCKFLYCFFRLLRKTDFNALRVEEKLQLIAEYFPCHSIDSPISPCNARGAVRIHDVPFSIPAAKGYLISAMLPSIKIGGCVKAELLLLSPGFGQAGDDLSLFFRGERIENDLNIWLTGNQTWLGAFSHFGAGNLTQCGRISKTSIDRCRIESWGSRGYGHDADRFRLKQELRMRTVDRRRHVMDGPVSSSFADVAVPMHDHPIAGTILECYFPSVMFVLVKTDRFMVPIL